MNHRLRFIHNKTHDFQLTNDRINRRHPFAPRMVGFTPPYCPLKPYKWGSLLWSLLRNPKDQWLRVYGCPEEMPGAARLPNNLDLTEHWSGYSLVRPLLALRISLAGKDHPGIRYESFLFTSGIRDFQPELSEILIRS